MESCFVAFCDLQCNATGAFCDTRSAAGIPSPFCGLNIISLSRHLGKNVTASKCAGPFSRCGGLDVPGEKEITQASSHYAFFFFPEDTPMYISGSPNPDPFPDLLKTGLKHHVPFSV